MSLLPLHQRGPKGGGHAHAGYDSIDSVNEDFSDQNTSEKHPEQTNYKFDQTFDAELDLTDDSDQELKAQASDQDGAPFVGKPLLLWAVGPMVAAFLTAYICRMVTSLDLDDSPLSPDFTSLIKEFDAIPLLMFVVVAVVSLLRFFTVNSSSYHDHVKEDSDRKGFGFSMYYLFVVQRLVVSRFYFYTLVQNGSHMIALAAATMLMTIVFLVSPSVVTQCQVEMYKHSWSDGSQGMDWGLVANGSCVSVPFQIIHLVNGTCGHCARSVFYANNSAFFMYLGAILAFVIMYSVVPSEDCHSFLKARYAKLYVLSPMALLFVETADRISYKRNQSPSKKLLLKPWFNIPFTIGSSLVFIAITIFTIWWQLFSYPSPTNHTNVFGGVNMFWFVCVLDVLVVVLVQIPLLHVILKVMPMVVDRCSYDVQAMSLFLLPKYRFCLPFVNQTQDQTSNTPGSIIIQEMTNLKKDVKKAFDEVARIELGKSKKLIERMKQHQEAHKDLLTACTDKKKNENSKTGRTASEGVHDDDLKLDRDGMPLAPETTASEAIAMYNDTRKFLVAWMHARRFHFRNVVNTHLQTIAGIFVFLAVVSIVCMATFIILLLVSKVDDFFDVLFQPDLALLLFIGVYAGIAVGMVSLRLLQVLDTTKQQIAQLNRIIYRSHARYFPFNWSEDIMMNKTVVAEGERFEEFLKYQCHVLESLEERPKIFGLELRASYYNILVGYAITNVLTAVIAIITLAMTNVEDHYFPE